MPIVTAQIAAGRDDGFGSSLFFDSGSSLVELGDYAGSGQMAFFLFALSVPKGATILSAILQFRANANYTSTTVNLNIGIEASDNPSVPTTYSSLSGRTLGDLVAWNGVGSWSTGTWYDSPDITDIVQAIVNRSGWTSGNNLLAVVKNNGSTSSAERVASTYNTGTTYGAKLVVSYEAIGDVTDAAGLGDSVDGQEEDGRVTDAAGLGESADGLAEYETSSPGAAGFGDLISPDREVDELFADVVGFGDASDGFSWSAWLRTNRVLAVTRFYLTITGDADGTTDIEVPMSSFQARKRNANPTYLSVVLPYTAAAAEAITARANGEIVIEMAYLLAGVESVREEILRADLEQINPQFGPGSRSITLIGHKTITFANQEVELSDHIYKYQTDGRLGFRFAVPDPYLNPGDTAVVGEDSFTVDSIVYMVSAGSGQTVMEVQE